MIIMAGFGTPLMFILHTVISFQALLMAYQTLRAYAIERDPKRRGKPAASPHEVYSELRDRFGPVLTPIVNFHERVHNWTARRGIKEGSWIDEFIAYGLTYIASSFLLLFNVGKIIEYKLFPNRIDEELLGYKPEIYLESDHKRMLKNPRWKELFPKRNIQINMAERRNLRKIKLDNGKEMVIPSAIRNGPESGSNFYRIERELGKGGFGVAFSAKVAKGRMKGREVALKILKPGSSAEDTVRFFQEYLMMKRLEGVDGVIRPYEAGYYEVNNEKYYYIAMQLADGGNMNKEIHMRRAEVRHGTRDKLFTEEEVYDIAENLLKTVNAIHKKGIIHADLKPDNLFYVDGELKVADFGVSRFAPTGAIATDTLTGTTEYMPNDMLGDFFVRGDSAKYSEKTDLYAIGLILYQLLHDGRLPQHRSEEEKNRMEELFEKGEYAQWVDKKKRSSSSEAVRLLGKSRTYAAETSELEKFIAMLILENEAGINKMGDAVKKIGSSASRKGRAIRAPGPPAPGRAVPMDTRERARVVAMRTVAVGPPQIDVGAETVDLSSPERGPPVSDLDADAADFFANPFGDAIPPRGLDDLAGSETADIPSKSLLANLLSRRVPWVNFVLRTLAIFSTPFHEIGHVIAAKLSNVFIDWAPAGLIFTGEVRTERAPPLVRLGGVIGNAFGAAMMGVIWAYSGQPPYALSSILLAYICAINIASILSEVGGIFAGVGDLVGLKEAAAFEERVKKILGEDLGMSFREDLLEVLEENYDFRVRVVDPEGGYERFYDKYIDEDFLSDYRRAAEEEEDLEEFMGDYMRAISSIREGKLDKDLNAQDIVKFRKYFYRIYGNHQNESFNAQQIMPREVKINLEPSPLARIWAWINGDMIIRRAFKGVPENGEYRTFVVANYKGRDMVFYKSISHRRWRRIEKFTPGTEKIRSNISKTMAENAMELSEGTNAKIEEFVQNNGPLALEGLTDIGGWDNLQIALAEEGVPSLTSRSDDADRYHTFNSIGIDPGDPRKRDRQAGENWFNANIERFRGPEPGAARRVAGTIANTIVGRIISRRIAAVLVAFVVLFAACQREVIRGAELLRPEGPSAPVAAAPKELLRTVDITIDGESRTVTLPEEVGNREVASGYDRMVSPMGTHLVFGLEKTNEDVRQLENARKGALDKIDKKIAELKASGEDAKTLKVLEGVRKDLADRDMRDVRVVATVTVGEGQKLNAFIDDNGIIHVPVDQLAKPGLLAYSFEHEASHPFVREVFGTGGEPDKEERIVLDIGIKVFGPMIEVSIFRDEVGNFSISVGSVDPALKADDPRVVEAIKKAMFAVLEQIQKNRQLGGTVDEELEAFAVGQLKGMGIDLKFTTTTGTVFAEDMEIKHTEPYYAAASTKDGKPVAIESPEDAVIFAKKRIGIKRIVPVLVNGTRLMVKGEPVNAIIEDGIDIDGTAVGLAITEALSSLEGEGDIDRLPTTLVIAQLDQSPYMFEDHVRNGFIGVNKIVNEIPDKYIDLRRAVLKMGIAHELSHELSDRSGSEFEAQQLRRDTKFLMSLMNLGGMLGLIGWLKTFLGNNLESNDLVNSIYFQELLLDANRMGVNLADIEDDVDQMHARLAKAQISHLLKTGVITEYGLKELALFYSETPKAPIVPGTIEYNTRVNIADMAPMFQKIKDRGVRRGVVLETVREIEETEKAFDIGTGDGALAGPEEGNYGHRIIGGKSVGRSTKQKREIIHAKWGEEVDLLYIKVKQSVKRAQKELAGQGYDLDSGMAKGLLIKAVFEAIRDNVDYDENQTDKYAEFHYVLDINKVLSDKKGVCRHMGILVGMMLEKLIQEGLIEGMVFYVRPTGRGHGFATYVTSSGDPIVMDVAQSPKIDPFTGEEGYKTFGYLDDFRKIANDETDLRLSPRSENEKAQWWLWFRRYSHGVYDIVERDTTVAEMIRERKRAVEERREALGLGFDERTIIGMTIIPGDDDVSRALKDAREGREEEEAPKPEPAKVEPPSPEVMDAVKADLDAEKKPEETPKPEEVPAEKVPVGIPVEEPLEGIPVPEEEVDLNKLFAPLLGNITMQFNLNLITRQDWEDYKASVRNSPGAQSVSSIMSSVVSRITTSEEPYKEIFLMDRETGSPIFNSLVDGLFDAGNIKTERDTGIGPAVTTWLRRNTWGMPRLMRSLLAAPIVEEAVYRGLPLMITSIAAYVFTSGLDWMLIMHGMIVPQIFMAGKFVMDHARGNRSPPEIFKLLLVPSLVAVANAVVLPFMITNPLAFMGLSVFNHFLANLVVAVLNAVFPKLELGEARISKDIIWVRMEEFVKGVEGIDRAEYMQEILTDILAAKLEQIKEDVAALRGIEFDYFTIESMEFENRGDFNSVFSVTADTNIGQVVFGLRLLTPRVISDFDSIKTVANEGVKLANNYETGDKVIKIQKSYFINEDLDADMSETLESAGIYGFTIGEFVNGTDLDKVPEGERRESYRNAIKSLTDLWLNTYDITTGTGMVMYDLKGANFVQQYVTGEVFVADTGAIFPLDFDDLKGLIDQWLKRTRGAEPGSEESKYFREAINEAVREFFATGRARVSPLKIAALEVVTGVKSPPAAPIRAPLKLTAAETKEVLTANLRRLGPEGVKMLADVVAGQLLSPSKIVGQQKIEVPREEGRTEEVSIPETIKGVTGDYQIKEELGAGGFGVVMKGETIDGREAAVKVLLPDASPDITLKFFTEYLMMRELSDVDSVVDAYEIGTYKLNGQRYFYMVQEFVDGMSLWQFMNMKVQFKDKVKEEEVEAIASDLLEALGKIHEKGIIHADIKPTNILIARDKLKITDFGLSLYAPEGVADLGIGYIQGTPGYISTRSMVNGEYGPKTDLFALGHMLYELMNEGESPYKMTEEMYDKIINETDQAISPTLIRWAKDRDAAIELINLNARTPMERLTAKLLLENMDVQDGWLDEADKGGLETVGDALIMMTRAELPEGWEDLTPPEVPVALDDIMPAETMGDRVAPQIGKRARVIGIKEVDGKKYMQVETAEGRKKKKVVKDIELTKGTREKGGNIESLREFLNLVRATLAPDKRKYEDLVGAFMDIIDQSDPEDLPEFYTYNGKDLVADVFGYASAKPGENLIVLNEDITRYDLAWLHEFGEYLMRPEINRLQPRFEDGKLSLYLDGKIIGDAITLEGEPLAQAMKDPANPHYLLRAFQREVFTGMDKILTEDIKTRQIASILRDRMGEDVWTEPGMNSYRAAKGIRDFIRDRQTRYKADDRIVISYAVEGERERSFLLKQGTGDLVRFDVKDLEDLSRGRFVGAEMEILITGADPETQSPEEVDRYMKLARTAEDYLNGLTRNKLMDELRRITGDETLRFSDIGKDIYITDHVEGSNKHVFKIEFKSTDKAKTYTIAVATKTEQAVGDITATEIRELRELQKNPTQVVPRFGADKMWNGKRWFTEEFVEGKTATQLARAGELTLNMRKKIVALLLSVAVGLKGLTPLDIHGGNFVVRDDGEVVMVDIGERRFRLIREASANIENEEPRMKHKMLFLATLMAQYGFFDAEKDATGQRTIVGTPENNHFIFEAITENKDLAEGEGLDLLKEAYEYFKQRQAQDPEAIAQAFSDFKYRGGFRNVLYPMGISFSGTTEEMLPALVPFSNLFMKSLGSYLAKVESRRGPPEEEPAVEAPPAEAPAPEIETEPFEMMRLGKGFAMNYRAETVHMRGIAPDPRIVKNYLKVLKLRNPDDSLVVPAVRKVYLPMTTMWKRGPNIEEKTEDELPAETVNLLRAASEEGLFELVELKNLGDYDRAAEEIGANRDEFRALLYTSLIPFMSDYAGRNAQVYLMNQVDFVKDEGKMRDFGSAMAHTLKTLHANGIIAGDTHLGQFVVPPDGKHALRVDLVNIYSFDDIEERTIPDNVAAEYIGILNTLMLSSAAAEAFTEIYSKKDMENIALGAGIGKAQIKTARNAIQDLRSGVVDWIVTPGNEEMMMSAKPAVDKSASRKFRRDYGSDTLTEGYVYKAGMSDEEFTANLEKTFEDMLENMSRPEYANKKPRAIIYAPAERYDLVKNVLDKTLENMKLEKFADRITVLREGGIPDDGAVDEVMHVVLGKALLNYERFRKGDYEDVFGAESQKRLADLLKAMVMDPAAIDLAKDPKIIDKILDGIIELKIRAIDYEEIRDWKAAQDEILRSL
jgi:serine/threonine protein kinase